MGDGTLAIPLLICLTGAVVAAAAGLPAVNRRLSPARLGWLVALAPAAAFALLFADVVQGTGEARTAAVAWMPTLGLGATLYFDGLSALFALLITGIGAVVVVYAGAYFGDDRGAWRFLTYLLLFMTAMLGLVLAGDLITLFVFWEATSVTSFLLVGYKTGDPAARRGAFKALLITGGGGIALLLGIVLVGAAAGGYDYPTVLAAGDALRAHPWYGAMLLLVAAGAFTKSAQVPFHVWLPDAMTAPTPASAFLHSATMVKAGVYLLARINPALGLTEAWFWLLSLVGLATMLTGAYLGLKQNDLKALLAYSTVSQLGVLVMLIGQDVADAFKAVVIGIIAHALYKSALFLVVGGIDHATGTRDLRRLGGLRRAVPALFAVASVAALSMAGLPPMFGFLAKETRLAATTHPSVPEVATILLSAGVVLASALLLAQAGLLVVATFLGRPRSELHPHALPWPMVAAAAVPATLSLFVGVLPEPEPIADFLADAASAALGAPVAVSIALWVGLTPPFFLSLVAITLGLALFAGRDRVRAAQARIPEEVTVNRLFAAAIAGVDRVAFLVTRTQHGRLRYYLATILAAVGGLILLFGRLPLTAGFPGSGLEGDLAPLRVFTLLLSVAAAGVTVFIRRDLLAIVALGASGVAVSLLFALEPAPDVALVQIVVDLLTVVVLVLALTRLPNPEQERAGEVTYRQSRLGLLRDAALATGGAVVLAAISLAALLDRPRETRVTPFFEANAYPGTSAEDIVGAILIDFRALDTLIEITVFAGAGAGVYALLRYAGRSGAPPVAPAVPGGRPLPPAIKGIGGAATSPFVHLLAYVSLPLALVIAATHVMYGHLQPGDGFTAGVIVGLAVAFSYVVFGYHETKQRLHWLAAPPLIGLGLLLALGGATAGLLVNGAFFSPVDFGAWLGLPLPRGFYLTTSLLFELAICLTVVGSVSLMVDALGHPNDDEDAAEARPEPPPGDPLARPPLGDRTEA